MNDGYKNGTGLALPGSELPTKIFMETSRHGKLTSSPTTDKLISNS